MPSVDATADAELIDPLTAIVVRAAIAIHEQAGKDRVRRKPDGSPVTAADMAAQEIMCEALDCLEPKLPIISEEQAKQPTPLLEGRYFLVDPLDGTREFIAGLAEYVVNLALMTADAPILGVIAAPALGLIWRGMVGRGAERLTFSGDGTISAPMAIRTRPQPDRKMTVLVSRSHLDPRTQAFLKHLPEPRTVACGSALKFCRIAEGSADLYPRLAPTHDWDVAAGHAVVAAAGGSVLAPDSSPLRYGSVDLRIPGFIASGGMNKPITT